jgi:hypothetical protein
MKRPTNWLSVAAGLSLLLVMLNPSPLVAAQQISIGNNNLGQFQVFTLYGGVTVAGVGLRWALVALLTFGPGALATSHLARLDN